ERRAAETALRDSETTLRQKADDLTARNAELDAFAHSVAHDLKVPLSLLIGYTSYIEAGAVTDDPEQLALCIRAISQSARKINSIIDELLLLASVRKVEEVDVKPLDMADIVSDVMVRFADVIEQKDVKISVPKVWPIASGYAPWIEEVWANYLSNAIKYGGTPPRLQLGASVLDGPSSTNGHTFVRFWVRDNGDGITQAQQTRLFIPFERLDQVRVKGYGLGLSIVQRIMERLDGRAGVQSAGEPGQGSLFYFDLPQAKFL
ncbi:MAG: sensor histidine kinase, partial [Anaerolineae bacterium]